MRERVEVSDVAQVYELLNEYAAAQNDGDVERWLALWSDDGIQTPPVASQRVGTAEMRRATPALFHLPQTANVALHPDEVRILGKWAYSHGTYQCDIRPKRDGPTEHVSGRFLSVFEKQADGSWRIAIDCLGCASLAAQGCSSGGWEPLDHRGRR